MTVELVFQPGGANELTLDEGNINLHNNRKTHTGLAIFRATVAYNRDLESYAQRQDRLNVKIDGSVEWCGFLIDVKHDDRGATTEIMADGIGKRLEETRPDYDALGGPVTYSNIALEDALDDYWGKTPFFANVTAQTTQQVADDELVQEANRNAEWSNITSFSSDEPFTIQNDNIVVLDTTDLSEAENETTASDNNTIVSSGDVPGSLSNNQGVALGADGEDITKGASFAYDVPSGEAVIDFYATYDNFDGELTIRWNGTDQDTVTYSGNTSENNLDSSGFINTDIGAGSSNTVEIECTSYTSGRAIIDTIQVVDLGNRFSEDWDITRSGTFDSNSLTYDAPELAPGTHHIDLTAVDVSFNINETRFVTSFQQTTNNQALESSLDGGSTFKTSSNTETATFDFSNTNSRSTISRLTVSRFTADSSTTPSSGDAGTDIESYELYISGDDLAVVDQLELSQDHFSNLKTLHEYGDFIWVIEHGDSSVAGLTVNSFQRGDETRPKPTGFDDQMNQRPEIQAGSYFNQIYLEGALRDDGTRPTAVVEDSTAISNDGRVISPGVLRDPNISTGAGAVFKARQLLESAQQNNNLVGDVTTVPIMTHPGYARPVDFGDGEKNKTVEEIRYTESTNTVEAVFDFTVREGLSEEISQLKRNARAQSNQI